MVDFNNDSTISTPAVDIVRVLILERRNNVVEAFEYYNKQSFGNFEADTDLIKSRIYSFYLEIQGLANKRLKYTADTFTEKIKTAGFNDLLKIFGEMNLLLYEITLTKIDNKPEYDTTNIELENKVNKL